MQKFRATIQFWHNLVKLFADNLVYLGMVLKLSWANMRKLDSCRIKNEVAGLKKYPNQTTDS